MEIALRFAFGLFVLLSVLATGGWVMWRLLKNSTDPAALLFRWIITLVVIVGGYFFIDWIVGPQGGAMEKMVGLFAGMFLGLILAGLWVPPLVEKVSDWFGGLYTGGSEPPSPQPFYSVAETRRKQARYQDAIYEIQQQLDKFPSDVTGHVLLAAIHAENLHDFTAATATIDRFCAQPEQPAAHVAYALNALADWHLKAHQPEEARHALERLIARLPDTEQARMAGQRIAHLATSASFRAQEENKPIQMRVSRRDLGLLEPGALAVAQENVDETTEQLVQHLNEHPLDNEAREKLALLYSEHYQRLDLATEQLELLVATPHQAPKDIARWINRIADAQIKHGADIDTVRHTLKRVVDLFPGLAAAQLAQQRLEYLPLEFKGKGQGRAVQLGTYEKDLGLKRDRPPAS